MREERLAEAQELLGVALRRLGDIDQQLSVEERASVGRVSNAYKYGSATQGQMFDRADAGLGGRIISYWVGPGEHWYQAHLAAVADLRVGDPVSPGTLIGTVGRSGSARTTPPHLHIGHYVVDVADNPFPDLERACP